MKPELRRIIMRRMNEDYRDQAYDSEMRDNTSNMHHAAYREGYDSGYEDGRRSMTTRKRRDMNDDFDDEDYDRPLQLSKKVKEHWLRSLRDIHGRHEVKFNKEDVSLVADKMHIEYRNYSPSDLCMVTNMLYSNLSTFRQFVPKDNEIYYWVAAAKEWLEDPDSTLTGSDKLVSYYYNVANG